MASPIAECSLQTAPESEIEKYPSNSLTQYLDTSQNIHQQCVDVNSLNQRSSAKYTSQSKLVKTNADFAPRLKPKHRKMAPSSTSLHMVTKLSPYVFTYEPSETYIASGAASSPKLIFLAAWMDAQDVHIAKYITHYQSIYPNATILLLKFVMKEAMLAPVASSAVQPAVWYLRSMISAGDLSATPDHPEILAHLFSNGGATSMQNVYISYQRIFGQPFPLHCTVFDSCPGLHAFSTSYNALIAGFPRGLVRFFVAPFVILMMLTSWIWHIPLGFLGGEDFLSKNARVLNDPKLVKQTNRTYIYGKADNMVDWHHVEKHANRATSKGFDVRKESFDNSPHVAHMRTDSERYWSIVEGTWEKATNPAQ
ncbi:hypothetical protein F5Y12DRAFT_731750 [Xylaria sp. FL1777]|nr:hypothetical protein F5Y12DRAFT_731750 [Xylaria sp. FL1777]